MDITSILDVGTGAGREYTNAEMSTRNSSIIAATWVVGHGSLQVSLTTLPSYSSTKLNSGLIPHMRQRTRGNIHIDIDITSRYININMLQIDPSMNKLLYPIKCANNRFSWMKRLKVVRSSVEYTRAIMPEARPHTAHIMYEGIYS